MEIDVGNKFKCIKDVIMHRSGDIAYTKDKIYKSELKGCITDNENDKHHRWGSGKDFDEHFILIQDEDTTIQDKDDDKNNSVNHPKHYNQGGVECIDAMLSAFGKDNVITFCKLNAFKYLWRASHKNGDEDLAKADWYLDKALELSKDLKDNNKDSNKDNNKNNE